MKCLCGLNEKPDNLKKLRSHLEDCLNRGRIPHAKKDYLIVWKNGEFVVTDKKKKNEQDFGTKLPSGKTPGLTTKVGLPSYTPTESLLSRVKTKRNAIGEEEVEKPKRGKKKS